MSESNWITIVCDCCRLHQPVKDVGGRPPEICATCWGHRGQRPETAIARAESHEAMLRERYTDLILKEDQAQRDLTVYRGRVAAALASRGALAAQIVNAAGPHELHRLGRDQRIVKWAQRHQAREQYDADRDW